MVHFQQGCPDPQPNRKEATNISPDQVERLQTRIYWNGKENVMRITTTIWGGGSWWMIQIRVKFKSI